jgi:CRISPR type III-B/RAMP module RAMP protein Cmr6
VSAWHTRTGRPETVFAPAVSPSLAYHKWHAYDAKEGKLETEESRVGFLEEVAKAVERARGAAYAGWYRRYTDALQGVGLPAVEDWPAGRTVWRLIAGYATNPALETGLTLHPLHGFPYLPGSGVRGLAHHVAEMELLEKEDRREWSRRDGLPERPALGRFLDDAEEVKLLFGSLIVELRTETSRSAEEEETMGGEEGNLAAGAEKDPPPATPRSLLKKWLASGEVRSHETLADRLRRLLEGHTGGLLAFYDAVPDPAEGDLLQVDILNPHYPDYYNSQGKSAPPSDDQNPTPIYFLAVRPGARFVFPFRLAQWPREPGRDAAERERLALLHGLTAETAPERVRGWLTTGLTTWGAGAKTAAGYGYFEVEGREGEPARAAPPPRGPAVAAPPAEAAARAKPAKSKPGAPAQKGPGAGPPSRGAARSPAWEAAVRRVNKENAETEVLQALNAAGAERTIAALKIVQALGGKFLGAKRGKPWRDELMRAAGIE